MLRRNESLPKNQMSRNIQVCDAQSGVIKWYIQE